MGELVLLNYCNFRAKTGVDINDLKEIVITVITGDEIADVRFKNGKRGRFDSAGILNSFRIMDYYDGSYVLLDEETNLIEEFEKRKTSYDMFYEESEEK